MKALIALGVSFVIGFMITHITVLFACWTISLDITTDGGLFILILDIFFAFAAVMVTLDNFNSR